MVMTPFIAGGLGALIGLLIAVFANLFVLPTVLRAQEDGYVMGRQSPLAPKSRERVARFTTIMYRIMMPLLFSFVGAMAGLSVFGG